MIRVLVNGAKGRMGSLAAQSVAADPELKLVGTTDKEDDLVAAVRDSKAQVVVDFTIASAGYRNFQKIIEAGAHPVVGTSGFNQEQVTQLRLLCLEKALGGLIAPNFAIGAVLMMRFAEEAAKYMPYVEIIETHHEKKLDAPSGTATRTAEMIATARNAPAAKRIEDEELIEGVRGGIVAGVRVHSVRMPGFIAHQRVIFGAAGQTLTLEHNSADRESFMGGVCLAAKKIVGSRELFYGLEKLMFSLL